jgi:glycosyltransferase involved in cell wall biosynthesis
MRILFDLRNVGLGDNGGSSTIVKSANTLTELGHDVICISTSRNKHTWTKLNAKHITPIRDRQVPNADAIIATGYKSVGPTVRLPDRCGLKMIWIRAWETWQMTENQIVENILKTPLIKLVNSICLKDKLKSYQVDSHIIRPGYDFDQMFPINIRGDGDIVVGGLYREGIHGYRKRTSWIFESFKIVKKRHKSARLWLFGSEKNPAHKLVDMYLQKPTIDQKNRFYNKIDIWLAPTKSEGLHMPPAEAMLTECPVVGTNAELSGTQDYLIDGETGLISKNRIEDFASKTEYLIEHRNKRLEMGKAARKKVLSLGDRKENMKKLVELIERLKNV